jgi:hypothetical protein
MVSVVIVVRRSHGAQVLEHYVVARLLQSEWVTSIPSPAIGSGKRLVVPVNPVQLAMLDYISDRMIMLTGMR